jgi:hypothetical protein
MVMTDDPNLATKLKYVAEEYRDIAWWKFITKYFNGEDEDPVWSNSESSRG